MHVLASFRKTCEFWPCLFYSKHTPFFPTYSSIHNCLYKKMISALAIRLWVHIECANPGDFFSFSFIILNHLFFLWFRFCPSSNKYSMSRWCLRFEKILEHWSLFFSLCLFTFSLVSGSYVMVSRISAQHCWINWAISGYLRYTCTTAFLVCSHWLHSWICSWKQCLEIEMGYFSYLPLHVSNDTLVINNFLRRRPQVATGTKLYVGCSLCVWTNQFLISMN